MKVEKDVAVVMRDGVARQGRAAGLYAGVEGLAQSLASREGRDAFDAAAAVRLELANGDSPATDGVFSHPYHPSLIGTDTIHHDRAHASRVILPVVPGD